MSDIVERLMAHMGKADMGEVLADCRLAADEITRLRYKLATARNEALEEAAVVADALAAETSGILSGIALQVAEDIRALKEGQDD